MMYENCGQKTEVKPKTCVCELLWCVRRRKRIRKGGKGLVHIPKNLLTVESYSLGDKENAWVMSRFEAKMREFEWTMSNYEGDGAAETDDFAQGASDRMSGFQGLIPMHKSNFLRSKAINHQIHQYKAEFPYENPRYHSPVPLLPQNLFTNQPRIKHPSRHIAKQKLQNEAPQTNFNAKA